MLVKMAAAHHWDFVSEEDYLSGELVSDLKHEYIAGVIYAKTETKNRHNDIGGNCLGNIHNRLRGNPCKPCNSDVKVRIRMIQGTRYYYPDFMVVCNPNPDSDSYQDAPVVIGEILSDSTRRTDEGEKLDAYQTIPSLGVYVMIEQDSPLVVVHRRSQTGFERTILRGLDAVIDLPEIETELTLAEIYDGIEFDSE